MKRWEKLTNKKWSTRSPDSTDPVYYDLNSSHVSGIEVKGTPNTSHSLTNVVRNKGHKG
jgi:hypothetical protein